MQAVAAPPAGLPSGELVIRPAYLSDIEAIVALHREAFADTFGAAFGAKSDRGAQALATGWRRQGPAALRGMLVAEYGGQLIGTTSLRTRDMIGEVGGFAESAFFELLGLWGALRSLFALSLLDHQIGHGEGFIADVAVAPEWRRRGVARALLQRVEDDARRRGLAYLGLYVRENNHGARALYERLGFQALHLRRSFVGRLFFGQEGWIYMRKDLA
ncbi:GNAT family N-acetyltransferase [Chloroflexus sp.]|uniref:GNAT family N-acetyltransferase n=1 Tax=Chloroflexus sp. TaxID=1904827 RepID=UPI00261EE60B|nr:N-acetyltransferase [uncultured Chloroflexus sp.]